MDSDITLREMYSLRDGFLNSLESAKSDLNTLLNQTEESFEGAIGHLEGLKDQLQLVINKLSEARQLRGDPEELCRSHVEYKLESLVPSCVLGLSSLLRRLSRALDLDYKEQMLSSATRIQTKINILRACQTKHGKDIQGLIAALKSGSLTLEELSVIKEAINDAIL